MGSIRFKLLVGLCCFTQIVFAQAPSCPYSAADLKSNLGIKVSEGVAAKVTSFAGGKVMSCRYDGGVSDPAMQINITAYDNPKDPSIEYMKKMQAGKVKLIAGDVDGAGFQEDQGDLTNASLHYVRQGYQVEMRVFVGPKDKSYEAIRQKLAKLKRLPG